MKQTSESLRYFLINSVSVHSSVPLFPAGTRFSKVPVS